VKETVNTENLRAEIIVTGKVQGVGFRAWVQKEAKARGLFGEVKNLIDGSVYAVFEGKSVIVEEMISRCQKGPALSFVDQVQVTRGEPSDGYQDFRITY